MDTRRILSRPLLAISALAVVVAGVVAVRLPRPQEAQRARSAIDTTAAPVAGAAGLVTRRCAACHAVPTPDVLPKSGWRSFLAEKEEIIARFVASRGLDPELLLQPGELQAVTSYYTALAPTQEQLIGPPAVDADPVAWFESAASRPVDESASVQGYIDVFVDRDAGLVLLSDFAAGGLQLLDFSGDPVGFVPVGFAPARIEPSGTGFLVPLMEGTGAGKVVQVDIDRQRPRQSTIDTVLEGLHRPIRAYAAHLFGTPGLLVEDFGGDRGGLQFWPRDDAEGYGSPRSILDVPGVVGSAFADFDEDGREDLAVLVSQELEQLLLYPDVEAGATAPAVLFQGHPGYGFNGLLLADVDGDRRTDIITTNGDNYDIASGPLKPYHGIRIFTNRGGLSFRDPLFLPFHGAIDVLAEDFDLDGDLDLVALSAFPDHRARPYRSAVVFEQIEPLQFAPRVIEPALGSRWVAAAATDLDRDGDADLILGGAQSHSNEADRRWSELAGPDPLLLLFLRNTTLK